MRLTGLTAVDTQVRPFKVSCAIGLELNAWLKNMAERGGTKEQTQYHKKHENKIFEVSKRFRKLFLASPTFTLSAILALIKTVQ
jgi:hypothetical protein